MKKILFALSIAFAIGACTKENNDDTSGLPETYSFTRNNESSVSYSGQTERQEMLTEMSDYMKKANALGTSISADTLQAMYKNEYGFTGSYEKNLFSKTFAADQDFFLNQMTEMALASQSLTNALPGKAGVLNEEYPVAGTSASSGYLVNANGLEYRQLIVKGLMGAVFFNQAMEVYFGTDYMNQDGSDNQTTVEGKNYTDMEHHFDEAFGYAGIPTNLSSATTDKGGEGVGFWGEYLIERSNDNGTFAIPGLNDALISAFIKGRQAIVDKNYTERNVAINEITKLWEKAAAFTAGNYFKRAITEASVYKKHHYLSEGIALLLALQYHFDNGTSVAPRYMSSVKIDEALSLVGLNTNLYNVTEADLNTAIAAIYAAEPLN